MSHDLEDLFAGLRADLADASLTEPGEVRRLGARRDRVRNVAGGCAAAVVMVAALGTGVALAHRPTAPPVTGQPSASATAEPTRTPSPTPSTTPPEASRSALPQGSPSRTAPLTGSTIGTCVKADLKVQSITTDYAMGTQGETVTVINRSGKPCALAGYAVLEYTTSGGTVARLPVTRPGTPGTSFELRPGKLASFIVTSHPTLGGYDPTDPACAHPATYSGLSILFADKQRLALTGLTINVKCGDISLQPWQAGIA